MRDGETLQSVAAKIPLETTGQLQRKSVQAGGAGDHQKDVELAAQHSIAVRTVEGIDKPACLFRIATVRPPLQLGFHQGRVICRREKRSRQFRQGHGRR